MSGRFETFVAEDGEKAIRRLNDADYIAKLKAERDAAIRRAEEWRSAYFAFAEIAQTIVDDLRDEIAIAEPKIAALRSQEDAGVPQEEPDGR